MGVVTIVDGDVWRHVAYLDHSKIVYSRAELDIASTTIYVDRATND